MTDHSENSLGAVVKSLRDIVGPAVDPVDPLAQEQLALSIGYLEFLRDRLAHVHTRARFELDHHRRIARSVLEIVSDAEIANGLRSSVRAGEQAARDADGETHAIERATAAIAADLRTVLRADLQPPVQEEVERAVMAAMPERVEFERSWYLPMGFDPAPDSAQPLVEFIAAYESLPPATD
ncbi:hypothetical protein [Nocardia jiangxiensis]|uniref:Uncharacterized protein n=1 Tax=Nocardia jiangxiensis TaxID=282685 RepID=A0ABW6S8N9_9NOCA|nr:hypothetical protein [Nocardia jiangxiensis]